MVLLQNQFFEVLQLLVGIAVLGDMQFSVGIAVLGGIHFSGYSSNPVTCYAYLKVPL
jgi:hypothetical protein